MPGSILMLHKSLVFLQNTFCLISLAQIPVFTVPVLRKKELAKFKLGDCGVDAGKNLLGIQAYRIQFLAKEKASKIKTTGKDSGLEFRPALNVPIYRHPGLAGCLPSIPGKILSIGGLTSLLEPYKTHVRPPVLPQSDPVHSPR